jgi:DNA (cytosine-5)-methyltransferase 1
MITINYDKNLILYKRSRCLLKKLRVIELFAGIGAWSKALENLNIPHEVVLAVENDEKTIHSYNLIHNTNFKPIDITKLNEKEVPDCDIICYSPPCQAFSQAGKQLGFEDQRGILFFDALRIIKEKKPKYALMENVKGLTQKKFKNEFAIMLDELERAGYKNYWKVLNAKDYGKIPQNRERVFIVSVRNDVDQIFEFPEPINNEIKFEDLLETDINVIKKYLHSQAAIDYMNKQTKDGRTHWDFQHHSDTNKQWSSCLVANLYKGVPNNVLIDRRIDIIESLKKDEKLPVIRKFTPKECFRLMGFDDKDHDVLKENKISNTQLYRMAGNSIVVDVVERIFYNLLIK